MSNINETKVKRLIKTIDQGLCQGIGSPQPGHMCVMHAISVVIENETYSDQPLCVHPVITEFDIELNDSRWSSNRAGLVETGGLTLLLYRDTPFDNPPVHEGEHDWRMSL